MDMKLGQNMTNIIVNILELVGFYVDYPNVIIDQGDCVFVYCLDQVFCV